MQEQRFKVIPTVYLILTKGDAVLLARRRGTGFHDGEYSLPAGHVDGGETLAQALIREAREEIGIDLENKNLNLVHVIHRREQNEERLNFFFAAAEWRGNPNVMEPEKSDDLSWFRARDLPRNTVPYVRQAIDCIERGIIYSEYGW
jgi:8-oxo-dGTP diphosphatase